MNSSIFSSVIGRELHGRSQEGFRNCNQDERFTLSFKYHVLNRIEVFSKSYNGIKKDIERIITIRNQISHESIRTIDGKLMLIDKKGNIPFEPIYAEYVSLGNKALVSLREIIDKGNV